MCAIALSFSCRSYRNAEVQINTSGWKTKVNVPSFNAEYSIPGDYEEKQVKSFRTYRLPKYIRKQRIKSLMELNTELPPYFSHYCMLYKDKNKTLRNSIKTNYRKLNDSPIYVDEEARHAIYIKPLECSSDNNLLLVLLSKTTTKEEFGLNLIPEFSRIVESVQDSCEHSLKLDDPFSIGFEAHKDTLGGINYIKPVIELSKTYQQYIETSQSFAYAQALSTFASFLSKDKDWEKGFDLWLKRTSSYIEPSSLQLPKTTVASLLDLSKGEGIVILNENHFFPSHRLLLLSMLDELYERGFRQIGFEALSVSDSLINDRGFPLVESGFYTREPLFGILIREAIKKGFRVFGYDKKGQGAQREMEQAKAIYRAYNSGGKQNMVVFCGFGHVQERSKVGKKMMAQLLNDVFKLRPYTISQTESYLKTDESAIYSYQTNAELMKKGLNVDKKICTSLKQDVVLENLGYTKVQYNIPEQLKHPTALLSVYSQKEVEAHAHPIPYFNTKLDSSQNHVVFYLPKGQYKVLIVDTNLKILHKDVVVVKSFDSKSN